MRKGIRSVFLFSLFPFFFFCLKKRNKKDGTSFLLVLPFLFLLGEKERIRILFFFFSFWEKEEEKGGGKYFSSSFSWWGRGEGKEEGNILIPCQGEKKKERKRILSLYFSYLIERVLIYVLAVPEKIFQNFMKGVEIFVVKLLLKFEIKSEM